MTSESQKITMGALYGFHVCTKPRPDGFFHGSSLIVRDAKVGGRMEVREAKE